jgi:stearoyl-CoA desaturase (delta-9 desaturase)
MKSYNLWGGLILVTYALACVAFAPVQLGPWWGLLVGEAYFIAGWFLCGLYLADVLHLGIAHRSLDFPDWFTKLVVATNNLLGIYVDPIAWVNRHRLHHKFSDHEGDPNKLAADGFWRTLMLCVLPYRTIDNVATDDILKTRVFRITAHPVFAVVSQVVNVAALIWLVGDVRFALVMWGGLRVFSLWVTMIQNYWAHTPAYGFRRYADERDLATNLGEWLPVTASFSASLQNNHHHSPSMLRLSHREDEYDFGFATIKVLKRLGLAKATPSGRTVPKEVELPALGF